MHEKSRMSTELPLGRRDEIAERLTAGQAVVASALAIEFEVSEDAIRRDLRALAAEGRCRRVYGGALPISSTAVPLAKRIDEDRPGKRALAVIGAQEVRSGECIFVDSGSTNLSIVDALPDEADLTLVTNAPDIAAAALRRADLTVIMIGGLIDPMVGGCVDAVAVQTISQMRFDRAFIGACAVTPDGIAALHHADAAFKRHLLPLAAQTVVLATTAKLDVRAPHLVAPLERIDLLVVEYSATRDQRVALETGGCGRVVIAASL